MSTSRTDREVTSSQEIHRDGQIVGHRLYREGVFNFPSFCGYEWVIE